MRPLAAAVLLAATACDTPPPIDGLLPADNPDLQYIEWVSVPRSDASATLVGQAIADSTRAPVAYVGATWCGSCKAYKQALASDRMTEVHASIQIIELDLDHHRALLSDLGITPAGVPHWEALSPSGHSRGLHTDGRAFASDGEADIAPVLAQFFAQVKAG